jgi:hypothetical protein
VKRKQVSNRLLSVRPNPLCSAARADSSSDAKNARPDVAGTLPDYRVLFGRNLSGILSSGNTRGPFEILHPVQQNKRLSGKLFREDNSPSAADHKEKRNGLHVLLAFYDRSGRHGKRDSQPLVGFRSIMTSG